MVSPDDTPSRDDVTTAPSGDAAIEALRAENAVLRVENAGLMARLADLFGVKLVTATIGRISQDCAGRLQGFADAMQRPCGRGTGQAHG